jgi:hypothetical protein
VLVWARKPSDLRASEVAVLVAEIDRLRGKVVELQAHLATFLPPP